jgi:hypothetical protein
MRSAGNVVQIGEKKNIYRILVGKPEGKRSLGRPRRRWVSNIEIGVGEIELGSIDRIDLVQYRDQWMALVSMVMNLRILYNIGKFFQLATSKEGLGSMKLVKVLGMHFLLLPLLLTIRLDIRAFMLQSCSCLLFFTFIYSCTLLSS